jgi:hypothetical protein
VDIIWVKIESWHAVREMTKQITLCGLTIGSGGHEVRTTLPSAKSCETCLRIVARKADEPE